LDGTSSYFAMENGCIFRIASAEQEISVGNKAEHVDLDTDLRVTDDEAIHCLFCDAHGAFDNESAFLWAAEQGLTLLILSLIQNPSRLHYKSQWTLHLWRRALTKATTNGHDVTAALLLKEPINKRTQDDCLVNAANNGLTDLVNVLLASGATVRFRPPHWTDDVLYLAGHYAILELLLCTSTDPRAGIDYRRYPRKSLLGAAVAKGDKDTVKLLLDRGADIARDADDDLTYYHKHSCGDTALHVAVREAPCGKAKEELIQLLLSRGAVIKKNHLKKYPQDYIKENEEDLRKLFPPRKKSCWLSRGCGK